MSDCDGSYYQCMGDSYTVSEPIEGVFIYSAEQCDTMGALMLGIAITAVCFVAWLTNK